MRGASALGYAAWALPIGFFWLSLGVPFSLRGRSTLQLTAVTHLVQERSFL